MDYKDTVNLPKTEFPMKANLPQREPEILRGWEEQAIFQRLVALNAGRPGATSARKGARRSFATTTTWPWRS